MDACAGPCGFRKATAVALCRHPAQNLARLQDLPDSIALVDGRYAREIDVAATLALEAGRLAFEAWQSGNLAEEDKGGEPVTAIDRECSALIVDGISSLFGGDAVLSEEAPEEDVGRRLASERVWMIDPIDGTRDFVDGRSGYAVMIGLLEGTRPRLGVIMHPPASRLYVGVVGAGAWMIDGAGVPKPLAVSSAPANMSALRLVSSASHRGTIVDAIKGALGITDESRMGSVGVKAALIAQGVRDLYINPSRQAKVWDNCAPEALLVAAGGRVTDLFGAPLDYRRTDPKNPHGMVASSGAFHDEVVAGIAPVLAEKRR